MSILVYLVYGRRKEYYIDKYITHIMPLESGLSSVDIGGMCVIELETMSSISKEGR